MQVQLGPPVHTAEPPRLDQANPPSATKIKSAAGVFTIQHYRLIGGKRDGVDLIVIDSGKVRAAICPTRGMGLWKANIDGLDCSWQSPVQGPIHPNLVPLSDPNGLGWLDGFDELLVRCGIESFGAPDFAPSGQLNYGLHGRIANQPASQWSVLVDTDHSFLDIQGLVCESRFLQFNYHMTARYRFAYGQPTIDVIDSVENVSDRLSSMQMLYHINVGTPLLEADATMHLPASKVVARDGRAAEDLKTWQTYRRPTPNYVEQVYFSSPVAAADGWTVAVLAAPKRSHAFAVHYDTRTLPFFSQWKNTVGMKDGYVTGLEPGTGFPNPRTFEDQSGRVVAMQPGQRIDFHLRLEATANPERVKQLLQTVEKVHHGEPELVAFDAEWCTPRT